MRQEGNIVSETEKASLRHFKFAVYFLITMLLVAMAVMAFWLLVPPKHVIQIKQLPVPFTKDTAVAGEYVTLDISYCKNMDVDSQVSVTLVSSKTQLSLPVSTDSSHKGCQDHAHVPLPVPPQATSDTYHYHFRVVSKPNILHPPIVDDFNTATFKVIKSGE